MSITAPESLKATALTEAEKLQATALAEAEKLKASAVIKAVEKTKSDKTEAEVLKKHAEALATELKTSAGEDADNLLKLAEVVAKKQLYLLLENSMFKAIFSTIHDGAVVVDYSGKTLFYNKAAVSLLGLDSLKDHAPKDFAQAHNLYKPDKITPWPAGEDPLARALKGISSIGELIFVKNKTGEFFISSMAVPLSYGEKPVIVGGFVMFRKIQMLTDNY